MTDQQDPAGTQPTSEPAPTQPPADDSADLFSQFDDPELDSYAFRGQDQPDLSKAILPDRTERRG